MRMRTHCRYDFLLFSNVRSVIAVNSGSKSTFFCLRCFSNVLPQMLMDCVDSRSSRLVAAAASPVFTRIPTASVSTVTTPFVAK